MMSANLVNYMYNQQFQAILAESEEDFEAVVDDMIEFARANGAIEIQEWYKQRENDIKEPLLEIASLVSEVLK